MIKKRLPIRFLSAAQADRITERRSEVLAVFRCPVADRRAGHAPLTAGAEDPSGRRSYCSVEGTRGGHGEQSKENEGSDRGGAVRDSRRTQPAGISLATRAAPGRVGAGGAAGTERPRFRP